MAATRRSEAREWHLNCRGCGTPLEPQMGIKGSLVRLHPECFLVRRAWEKLRGVSTVLRRYHELKARGAEAWMASFGCRSETKFRAALQVIAENARADAHAKAGARSRTRTARREQRP